MNVWTKALALWKWVQTVYGVTLPAYVRSINSSAKF